MSKQYFYIGFTLKADVNKIKHIGPEKISDVKTILLHRFHSKSDVKTYIDIGSIVINDVKADFDFVN